jgi:hypothetical protein
MQIFVNELTLQEQYRDGREFEQSIISLLSIAKQIQEINYQKKLFSDKASLVGFKPIANRFFHESLREIDVGLRERFKRFIYDICDNWRDDRKHSVADVFTIGTHNITNTSVAELAERKSLGGISLCALLNFERSALAGERAINIVKNQITTIDIDCIEDGQILLEWQTRYQAILNGQANVYDNSSLNPPIDNQTILRLDGRFARTRMVVQGRTVYREASTGYYWHVDNLHHGVRSHIEVYDRRGEHVGEADLNGSLDVSKLDTTKKISL